MTTSQKSASLQLLSGHRRNCVTAFALTLPGKITAERSDTVALTVLSLVFLQELRHLIARKVCLPL